MKKYSILALILVLVVPSIAAATASNLDAQLRKMLALSGVTENVRQQLQLQLAEARRVHPDLPLQTWKRAEEEIQSPKMEDDMVAVWRGAFTSSELTDVIRFLSTATGKKFFKTTQQLMPRTAAVAALTGVRVYGVLQALHPEIFPHDFKSETQVRKVFEGMRQGTNAGGVNK